MAIGYPACGRHDPIQPKQPLRALEHRKILNDALHAQAGQDAAAFMQQCGRIWRRQLPPPDLAPRARRLQRHGIIAIDRILRIHDTSIHLSRPMSHIEQPVRLGERGRSDPALIELVMVEIQSKRHQRFPPCHGPRGFPHC